MNYPPSLSLDKSGQPSTQPLVTPTDNPKYGCPLLSKETLGDGRTDLEEVNSGTNPRINNTDKQHSHPASGYLEAELEL